MPDSMDDVQKIQAATEIVAKALFPDGPTVTQTAVAYLIGRFLADINDIAISFGCVAGVMIDQNDAMEADAEAAAHLHETEPKGNA
jgi:hypothetical protein